MTEEEIIDMVMQIGGCDRPEDDSPALKMFVTFAKLVAEHEREACAKEVENALYGQEGCGKAAKAIRLRGEA